MIKNNLKALYNRLNRRVCYIAGPIAGLNYSMVRKMFMCTEYELRDLGYRVINPVRFVKPDANWNDAMRICLMRMHKADVVYMQFGWETSDGAMVELFIALVTNKPVIFEGEAPASIDFMKLVEVANKYLPQLRVERRAA